MSWYVVEARRPHGGWRVAVRGHALRLGVSKWETLEFGAGAAERRAAVAGMECRAASGLRTLVRHRSRLRIHYDDPPNPELERFAWRRRARDGWLFFVPVKPVALDGFPRSSLSPHKVGDRSPFTFDPKLGVDAATGMRMAGGWPTVTHGFGPIFS